MSFRTTYQGSDPFRTRCVSQTSTLGRGSDPFFVQSRASPTETGSHYRPKVSAGLAPAGPTTGRLHTSFKEIPALRRGLPRRKQRLASFKTFTKRLFQNPRFSGHFQNLTQIPQKWTPKVSTHPTIMRSLHVAIPPAVFAIAGPVAATSEHLAAVPSGDSNNAKRSCASVHRSSAR